MTNQKNEPAPGDGIRSLKSTGIFRAVNFELYAKPVSFKWEIYNLVRNELKFDVIRLR